MLKIFNTLTRKKEIFKPIDKNIVKMYVCGMTVYDLCHIGHGRTFITFDYITRYLRYCGYSVNYIRNITDIDDKIIIRAKYNNETPQTLTNRMIYEMNRDFDTLKILRPNKEPRATQHIESIIRFIKLLLKKGYAYSISNGDIMFSVEKYQNYGELSKQNISKLLIKKNINKKHCIDFVLWKNGKIGEPSWNSPWGPGRPGWHIECSAMSSIFLGNHFDIHGGGSDLIFPHHENEIAQSVCAYESNPYVNIWIHPGMIMLGKKKISKSFGKTFTIRHLLKYFNPETIRYFLMKNHYRNQINYSEDLLKEANISLERLYIALRDTEITAPPAGGEKFINKFISVMNDDFNTPEAYSVLFQISHEINRLKNKKLLSAVQGMAATLRHLGKILGLLEENPKTFLKNLIQNKNDKYYEIELLIKKRNYARKNNQWELADELRNKLYKMGVLLEDNANGTFWKLRT